MASEENSQKLNPDSDSSSSGSISPAEDFSVDPNYKCNVRVVEPRTVNTRLRTVSEHSKSEGTSQKRPPVYKYKTIQKLHLHSVGTTSEVTEDVSRNLLSSSAPSTPMSTTPVGTDGVSTPVDTLGLATALASGSKTSDKSKPKPKPKVPIMDEDFQEAFLEMTESFKAIGQTAKQNNPQF